ncbi:MAG: hypothetical protein M3297_11290 [Thermoproteota archaeon]|nr:hypothetical protein [Thermoproteota archaeon]
MKAISLPHFDTSSHYPQSGSKELSTGICGSLPSVYQVTIEHEFIASIELHTQDPPSRSRSTVL